MTGTTGAPKEGASSSGASTARRGSSFSDKQIFAAVRADRRIKVTVEGECFEGWVFGVDDFHWGIVDEHGATALVHKSAPLVRFLPAQTLPSRVEAKVAPFRRWVLSAQYGQSQHDTDN